MGAADKNMIAFRGSRKGYDRSDVNKYIEEMSIRFTSAEAKYKERIEELEAALSALEGAKDADKELGAELEEKVTALEAENASLREKLEELEAATKVDAESEDASEPQEDQTCFGECEDISTRLGRIILKANLDADRIVSEAEQEAAKQISDAEKNADGIKLDAAVSARLMTASVKEKLTALAGSFVSQLGTLSGETVGEYRKLCEELKLKLDSLKAEPHGIVSDINKE